MRVPAARERCDAGVLDQGLRDVAPAGEEAARRVRARRRHLGARRRQLSAALALLFAAPAFAEARFEWKAELRATARALLVELRLRNTGDSGARQVFVEGELAGQRASAELPSVLRGEEGVAVLRFPPEIPRPGRHALTLLIEHRPEQPADAPPRGERGYLLLELLARPQPALQVRVEPAVLDVSGLVHVVLESADGAAHRAGLRVLPPWGINVLEAPAEVVVPGSGQARVLVRLIRGSAARGSRHGLIVVASPLDGPLERASVAQGEIVVAADPAWLPRLRPALFALGALLLIAAAVLELRSRRPPNG